MPCAIFNREDFQHPKDGWYMIEPKGEHPNDPSGVVQVIDTDAIASIVNRFNGDADAGKLSHGSSMLIDHEHFKHDPDKETTAYGWLTKLQGRADGIYGQVRWTRTGQPAIDGGDYRFFSTEYDPSDVQVLGKDKPSRIRPLRLDGLTLTNQPNNKGGEPITNRSPAFSSSMARLAPDSVIQAAAARHVAKLIAEEQKASGMAYSQAMVLVQNREQRLVDLATGKLSGNALLSRERESRQPACEFAAGLVAGICGDGNQAGTPSQKTTVLLNRMPRLAKMVNQEAGWDCLEDLEPVAHAAYMKAIEGGEMPAQILFGGKFISAMQQAAMDYPNLGFEGRWNMVKATWPGLFWRFVLEFDPDYGKRDEYGNPIPFVR